MVRCTSLLSLAAAAGSALAKKSNDVLPGAFIFEFADAADTADFHSLASNEGTVRMNLDYELFKGVSVQLKDADNGEEKAKELAKHPAIVSVWPVTVYDTPSRVEWTASESKDPAGGAASSIKKRADEDVFDPHVMTQVNKLREKGYTGKGIKIAIVDTGIDYTHEALGDGCFGEGCKVAFGYDLVGDDYTGFNQPVPDDDPMDCAGHGTHVAGTVAANLNPYNFTGVAPDATLGAYRVLGCEGSVANDVLIAAFNMAYEHGVDIITASIGGVSGWSEDPWAVATSRIVAKGVPCTLAAGNDGSEGMFYASTAATGENVIAVASFDNTHSPTLLYTSTYTIDGGEDQDFGYTPSELPSGDSEWDGVNLPIWTDSTDITITNGGCDPFPEGTPDLSGYIVVVRRGSCSFAQKANNAAAAGAKYFIVYNNVAGTISMDLTGAEGLTAAAMVTSSTGETWVTALADGSEVVLSVVGPEKADRFLINPENNASGGALSTYTTWGSTYEMATYPNFGAPGGNILSTYPVAKGSYAVLSGTSMATPLVAGVVALLGEIRGTFDPLEITKLLSATSKAQVFNDGQNFYEFFAPTAQQGAGIIQADDAAFATALIDVYGLAFNDTENLADGLNFTISNTGDDEVTYTVDQVAAPAWYVLPDGGDPYPLPFPAEPVDGAATLSFSESKVTVGAGDYSTVFVDVAPPEGLDAKRLPYWSGWVTLNGTDGSSYVIPYSGLAGNLREATVLPAENSTWITASNDKDYNPVEANKTFTIPAPGSPGSADTVLPTLAWDLAMGSPYIEAYIVPLTTCPPKNLTVETHGIKNIGQPVGFPSQYFPRGLEPVVNFYGQLADGNYAPPGKYKIHVRALHINGDRDNEEDWDEAETQSFRIKYE